MSRADARLRMLALGSFALGTSGFVVAGILPTIAGDLDVPLADAGRLLSLFALVYGTAALVLGPLAARFDRRTVLVVGMAGFTVAHLVAAVAPDMGVLLGARIAAAVFAGLYSPTAMGVAVALSPPEERGRAVAAVLSGMTVAMVLGVPLGSLLGGLGSWRSTFVAVAVLGAAATVGLARLLPRLPVAPAAAAPTGRPAGWVRSAVPLNLLAVFSWQLAMFVPFTFLAEVLSVFAGLDATAISALLLVYGGFAYLGNRSGGRAADRHGGTATVLAMLGALLLALTCLALLPQLPAPWRVPVAVGALALWGWAGWGIVPAQMSRLVRFVPSAAQTVLSLNTAVVYWGIAAGAWVGGVVLEGYGLAALSRVGAAVVAVVLVLLAAGTWAAAARPAPATAPPAGEALTR
ncbi:Major Facilitator Superfamily protein [Blastococcus sp. DSM 46786]|uniref:MFS transporter n=1 Tax=Blastococcus sp. DSM 46786 TaxID=1798227 RepID=UPI0008BB520C|nr:MFS transporter [Blastococcus sp. DSM 46786]SEM05875.1 Major Facilitator Superfamily protein [Blastococcus sp. DSM 46786]